MKPITPSDLQEILDTELVWRRRELTAIITTLRSSDSATKRALLRAAVPLLYAHWEGFGRLCFQRYLEHVSYKNIKYKDLHPAFFYLRAIGSLQEIGKSPAKVAVSLLPALVDMRDNVNRQHFRKMVDTKSNLRFSVLEQLCALTGIDISRFIGDESFIDRELCDSRNAIAHGDSAAPTEDVFIGRRDRAFTLMTNLQTELINAALLRSYAVT